jgi:hypothetical protein
VDLTQWKASFVEKELKAQGEQIIKLECDARNNNLRFAGIPEAHGVRETWDQTETVVRRFLQEQMNIEGAQEIEISRAYRVGQKNDKYPRPIITHFKNWKDKSKIYGKKTILKNTQQYVDEDLPPPVVARQRKLRPIYSAIQRHNAQPDTTTKHLATIRRDRLVVDGKYYNEKTLAKLPTNFRPEQLANRIFGGFHFFFTSASVLSNHHPCLFEVDGTQYSSLEQYFFATKATRFGDDGKLAKTMSLTDPGDIKRLCSRVDHFNRQTWEREAPALIRRGLVAKFTQNEHLQTKLLASGSLRLAECSRSDCLWGNGLSITSDQLLQLPWPGKNLMGELLMSVREEIRENQRENTAQQQRDPIVGEVPIVIDAADMEIDRQIVERDEEGDEEDDRLSVASSTSVTSGASSTSMASSASASPSRPPSQSEID